MNKAGGTIPVFVIADIGNYKNYICVFRGSRDIYANDGISKIEPLGITGISAIDDSQLQLPKFEVAELIRKIIIVTMVISYQNDADMKSRRIYVAQKKSQEFMNMARAGNLTIGGKTITSAHMPTKRIAIR